MPAHSQDFITVVSWMTAVVQLQDGFYPFKAYAGTQDVVEATRNSDAKVLTYNFLGLVRCPPLGQWQ
jgi:hypothetical protein